MTRTFHGYIDAADKRENPGRPLRFQAELVMVNEDGSKDFMSTDDMRCALRYNKRELILRRKEVKKHG